VIAQSWLHHQRLFSQAGPLQKVSRPPGKPMAFITYKHSISLPYAKEVFKDTYLHNKCLNIKYRTGSLHANKERQQQYGGSHQSGRYRESNVRADPYNQPRSDNRFQDRRSNRNNAQNFYNNDIGTGSSSMPSYGSSRTNVEYEPQFVSFDSPAPQFKGAAPVNHPDHPVSLDERRQRLQHYQGYTAAAQSHRGYSQRDNSYSSSQRQGRRF